AGGEQLSARRGFPQDMPESPQISENLVKYGRSCYTIVRVHRYARQESCMTAAGRSCMPVWKWEAKQTLRKEDYRYEKTGRLCKKHSGFSGAGNHFPGYYLCAAGCGRPASGH